MSNSATVLSTDTACFLEDFVATLKAIPETYIEISYASLGSSQFNRAIYYESLTPAKILELGKSRESVSFLAACSQQALINVTPLQLMKRSAKNEHIQLKNHIAFDFDAKDAIPNYFQLQPEQRRQQILERCTEIQALADTHHLPIWFINFSGNGLHIHFKLQNPIGVTKDYQAAYTHVLEHLSALLGLPLDQACCNPSRLFRLPFSVNYKDKTHPIRCELLYHKDCFADDYFKTFFKILDLKMQKAFHGKNALLQRLRLENILDHFDYKKFDSLKDTGKTLVLSSPFKEDKNPSFFYEKERKIFYDFSLGEGGDLLTLIAMLAKLDTKKDFRALVQYAHKISGTREEALTQEQGMYELKESGVWFKSSEKNDVQEGYWICSHLEILACSRDVHNEAWGRLLSIRDNDGIVKTWAMPMEMLAGEGMDLRKKLLSLGASLNSCKTARAHLLNYITHHKPQKMVRSVERLGYNGRTYILPDQVFSNSEQEEEVVLYQPAVYKQFQTRGSLELWQKGIATYARGNALLTLALCASFCPPLLYLTGDENFGLHLVGPSSIGKTITLDVAGSVWGGGGIRGYKTRWRSTVNGLEALAVRHNDTLLTLDELAEVSPKNAGAAAYMLANGTGKQRAQMDASTKDLPEWRLCFLSTGEIDLASHLESEGQAIRAGQEIRMITIEAERGCSMGVFEELHGFASPVLLADHLRMQCACDYGTAIRAFLKPLLHMPEPNAAIQDYKNRFKKLYIAAATSGQKQRVLDRFALLYAAGCLAVKFAVLPLTEEELATSLGSLFKAWSENHAGEYIEDEQILSQIRQYLQTYASSRFPDIDEAKTSAQTVAHCAGFRRKDKDGNYEWIVLSEVFKKEICKGLDFKRTLRLLEEKNILQGASKRTATIPLRLPIVGQVRCILLSHSILLHLATKIATPETW